MRGSHRVFSILTGITLFLFASSAQAEAGNYGQTCRYFSAVAFQESHARAADTFRTRLASDCHEALRVMHRSAPGSAAHDRAVAYLGSMDLYREVITGMLTERFRSRAVARKSEYVARPVTRSGEILIAKVMGLLDTQTDWHAWRQALAE
ncbi:MAG: hypothetical protein AAGA19_13010 [Pseudomonadota bacterium]